MLIDIEAIAVSWTVRMSDDTLMEKILDFLFTQLLIESIHGNGSAFAGLSSYVSL